MTASPVEPNMETACGWWSDLPDIWTPVGWKNHLFRFNVLWNGCIIAKPDLNRRTEAWTGQGVQIAFAPSLDGRKVARANETALRRDDGMVNQGWNRSATPVLWTEWSADGLLLRQEVFAHVPPNRDVETGVEPLFAWIRLSVHYVCDALPVEPRHGFLLKISAPHFRSSMSIRGNRFDVDSATYPRRLRPQMAGSSTRRALRLLEAGGKVRLAVAIGRGGKARFLTKECGPDPGLHISMPARAGAHVDLLLPMVPTKRDVFDKEFSFGYDMALQQANRYWSPRPRTAARIDVPEAFVNDAIAHSLKFAEVIAERNPADGHYAFLTGSMTYANLWTTPHAQNCIMLQDSLGYHDVVEKHLELFRQEQGTVVAPGDSFTLHPGYLSSPKTLTSIDWLSDHGALLYTICMHALLSGNRRFTERWTEAIVKACEFIQYARSLKGHGGAEGVMPPAVATDRRTKIQGVWNDGWIYKGLTTAVRLLRQVGHPRAAEFSREAKDYRRVFQKALHAKVRSMPRWKDARGRRHPFVPPALTGDSPDETRHAFSLDTGPLFLVFSGLMDARDPLMRSTLLWFREGPQKRLFRYDGNHSQTPCLHHEMSTCEPCYSWNVFHSHQLADRQHFLEGMYSLLAGSLSRKTFTSCETRGGVTGTLFSAAMAAYMARLAVIDDQVRDHELHLLRLVPLAWLRRDRQTVFEKIPTEFGPVTLQFGLSRDGRTLRVKYAPAFRASPRRVVLHAPPLPGLKRLALGRKTWPVPTNKPIVLA